MCARIPEMFKLIDDLEPLSAIMRGPVVRHGNKDIGLSMWSGNTNVTATLHYDFAHNINVQIAGKKQWLLFPPQALDGNHTKIYPVWHPSERQFQYPVDFDAIVKDLSEGNQAYEVTMEPGDVMIIPAYWMHTVRAIEGPSISLNT